MKRRVLTICALVLTLCLLVGCAQSAEPSDRDHSVGSIENTTNESKNHETAAPDAASADSAAAQTEDAAADAPDTALPDPETSGTETPDAETSVPDTPAADTHETDLPETAAPETEPSGTEAPEDQPFFVQEADYFTNGIVKIWNEDGIIIQKDLESGIETILFRLEKNEEIDTTLCGVTDQRLYFGWNEVEDWWGYNVYSVDYKGENRIEYGSDWDPMFDGGWLILYGFRSDVSSTEYRVIDRNDMLVVDLDNVWDSVVADDGCLYFVYGGELPQDIGEWFEEHEERDVEYKILKLTPEGDFSVHGSLFFNTYYQPCFINFNTVGFPMADEYYDLYTLEPTEAPVYG